MILPDTEQIFVYGTLRPPRAGTSPADTPLYPQIAPYVLDTEPAYILDAVLYDLGAYPGALPGTGTLHGDLLRVQAEALAIADRIEGHPRFYRRKRITVHTGEGPTEAWIYWAPEELCAGRPRITGGDWFTREHDGVENR